MVSGHIYSESVRYFNPVPFLKGTQHKHRKADVENKEIHCSQSKHTHTQEAVNNIHSCC